MKKTKKALIIVDALNDFMPGGNLPVAGGDEIIDPISALIASGEYDLVVSIQEFHPEGHVSFASTHGKKVHDVIKVNGIDQMLWQDHCIRGTLGAEHHHRLDTVSIDAFIRKGMDKDVDSYSGFFSQIDSNGIRRSTGLDGLLRDHEITDNDVVALAFDYCAGWTSVDSSELGYKTRILLQATRSVFPENDGKTTHWLKKNGVKVI